MAVTSSGRAPFNPLDMCHIQAHYVHVHEHATARGSHWLVVTEYALNLLTCAKYRYGLSSNYSGDSKKGMRHGQGREEWENGIVYNGTWEFGLKCGLGVYFDPGANRYGKHC